MCKRLFVILLSKFSGLPGFHNIHDTGREHQERKETFEEKQDFVFMKYSSKMKKQTRKK